MNWPAIDAIRRLYPLPPREPEDDGLEDIRERERESAERDDDELTRRMEK